MASSEISVLTVMEERLLQVERYVSQYTFPVLNVNRHGAFELYGTGVGLQIAGNNYVCTASHLIESISLAKGTISVGVGGRFLRLNLDTARHVHDENVDYDVCFVELHDPASVKFLAESALYRGHAYGERRHYIQGFPISKNKSHKILDRERLQVSTGYLKLSVKIDQKLQHQFDNVSSDTHLLFKLDRSFYRKAGASFSGPNRGNSPGVRGCSGSGIWSIGSLEDISTIKLAGIFIAHKHGVGTGTKIIRTLEHFE